MGNVSDKSCRENQNTHFVFNNLFSFFEKLVVYEIIRKNILEANRPQLKIWCMRIACLIPKTKNTHSEYARVIVFSRPKWLREIASVLCAHCLCLYLVSGNLQCVSGTHFVETK